MSDDDLPVSRRGLLRATTGTVGAAAMATGGEAGYAPTTETTLLDEDFDSYAVGNYPSGWTKAGNQNQEVTDAASVSGGQSLRIKGEPGGCWEALADAPVDVPTSGTVVVSGWIAPTSNGSVGCHEARGGVEFRTATGGWSAGEGTQLFKFKPDGTITGVDGTYGTYNVDEWNSFRVTYERTDTAVTVSYRFNGDERGSGTRAVAAYEDDLSYLRLQSDDFSVYYDELTVTAMTGPSGPGVETRDFTGDGRTDVRVYNSETWLMLEGADRDTSRFASRLGRVNGASLGDAWDINPTTRSDGLTHRTTERVEPFSGSSGAGYNVRRRYAIGDTTLQEETTVYLPSNSRTALVRVRLENVGSSAVLLDQDRSNIHDGIMIVRGTPLNGPSGTYRFHTTGSGAHRFGAVGTWDVFDLSGTQPNVTAYGDSDAISYGLIEGATGPRHAVTNGDPPERVDFMVRDTRLDPGETATYTLGVGAHAGGSNAPNRALDALSAVAGRTDEIPAVGGGNETPTARAQVADATLQVGEETTLDASQSSDPDGEIRSYEWDLDGDGTLDTTGVTVTPAYDEPGEYTVRLRVTDDDGASDTDSVTVTVEGADEPPTAAVSYQPSSPAPDEQVTFDASDSTDPDGQITEYAWDVTGDGQFQQTSDAVYTHTYAEAGEYTVTVQVTDDTGLTDRAQTTVSVKAGDTAPTAAFDYDPSEPAAGEQVTFDASDSRDDGSVVEYAWDFTGDGRIDERTSDPIATYTYDESGEYAVGLTVTDDAGTTATTAQTVSVADNAAPQPTFTVEPTEPQPGEEVRFDASDSRDDGSVVEYAWDFTGDGQFQRTTADPVTIYTYDEADTYEVRLRVADDLGKTATVTKEVTIGGRFSTVKSRKLELAGTVDDASVLSTVEWATDAIGDEQLARETIAAWETAVRDGSVDGAVATEAVERLITAEQATRDVLSYVGPASDASELNFARRAASNLCSVVLDLLLLKYTIGKKLLAAVGGPVAGHLGSVATTTVEDAITGMIGDFLSLDDGRNQCRREATTAMGQAWETIQEGATAIADVMSEAVDLIVDSVTAIVRAAVEFREMTPFDLAAAPSGLPAIVTGNSVWGVTYDLHEQLRPDGQSTLPGQTSVARAAKSEAIDTIDDRAGDVASRLDTFTEQIADISVYESTKEVIAAVQAGEAVRVIWEAGQVVVDVALELAGVVLDATAAASAGLTLWQLRKLHDEVTRSVLTGNNEVSGWTPL